MEAPHLSSVASNFADRGVVFLAINAWDEPKEQIARYAKKEKLQQRILLDGNEVAKSYHLMGVPTTLWINREGVVTTTELDFKSEASLQRKCERLLSAGPS